MQINNPTDRVPYVKEDGGTILYPKLLNIGALNMNAVTGKNVAHGITGAITNIVSIELTLRNDIGNVMYPPSCSFPSMPPAFADNLNMTVDGTNIQLAWGAASFWSTSGAFNSVAIDRGTILIWFRL